MTNQTGAPSHRGGAPMGTGDVVRGDGSRPGDGSLASSPSYRENRPRYPLLTADEFDRINAAIWDRVWDDPTRLNDCLIIALGCLASIGIGEARLGWSANEATQAMRRMMQRVLAGEVHIEVEDHL